MVAESRQHSGPGAGVLFHPNRDTDWTWEDLEYSTMHPVDGYRIYRKVPRGEFECIHATEATEWPLGGDPDLPQSGQLFSYLVTAVSGGEVSSSGNPQRPLNPCAL